jgi:hypothetical protein
MTHSGTHKGEFMGIPPTGKSISWEEFAFLRIAEGKVAEYWSQTDSLGMMQQLGVIPAPGAKRKLGTRAVLPAERVTFSTGVLAEVLICAAKQGAMQSESGLTPGCRRLCSATRLNPTVKPPPTSRSTRRPIHSHRFSAGRRCVL